jgi:hypothetical protein
MSKAIRASVLILLLSCSAQAGYIPNETPVPPPSQSTVAAQETTTDGYIPNEAADSLTQLALDLLVFLPALL